MDERNECCKDETNLKEIEHVSLQTGTENGQTLVAERIVKQCQTCFRKHYELILPPLVLGTIGY